MSEKPSGNVRSSVRLSFLNTALTGLLQFIALSVLARLLSPADYGTVALCTAIASLSSIFVTNVIERILVVTAPDGRDGDEWMSIALLCILAGGLAVGICYGLNLLGTSNINLPVLTLILGCSVINAVAISPRVVLRRDIRFGPIAFAELTGLILGQIVTAIACAAMGWGAYALAAAGLVQSTTIALLLRLSVRTGPFAAPTPRHLGRLIRTAASLGGNAATEILNGQVSPLVLGTRLGAVSLGLFNRSNSLVQMPIQLLVNSMSRVMISALFSVREDQERLRTMARSLVRVSAVMATPVAAGIAGSSHNFVLFAFGSKWLAAEMIMPVLAVAGWGTMMGTLYGIMAEAMRAFHAKALNQLSSTMLLIVLSLSGAAYGLFWATVGIALSCCVFLLLFARLASRLLDAPFAAILGWLVPGLVVALPCLLISLALGHFVHGPAALVFAAQIAGCGLIDVVMLLLFYPALALQIADGMAPGLLRRLPLLAQWLQRKRALRP